MNTRRSLSLAVNARLQKGSVLNLWNFPKTADLVTLFGESIIGLWPLDEATGTVAIDATAQNNAAYSGVVSLSQEYKKKKFVNFLGTGNVNLYSASLASKININEGTLFFKIKNNTSDFLPTAKYLFALNVADPTDRFFMSVTGNLINLNHITGGVTKTIQFDGIYGQKWVSFAVRWSVANSRLDVFINGTQINAGVTGQAAIVGTILSSQSNIYAYSSSGFGRINASGCDIVLLNRPATDSEILQTVNPDGIVLFEGDSRSNIKGWTTAAFCSVKSDKMGYSNVASSGGSIQTMSGRIPSNSAKLISGKNNVLVVWGGINNSTSTASQIYDLLKNYCIDARASGWNKILLCTEIDGQSTALISAGWPAKYIELNTMLRADHSFADALADLGARTELQNAANTAYFDSDKIHINAGGAAVVREVVAPILATLA